MLAKCQGEDLLLACRPLAFITGFIAYKTESARCGASFLGRTSSERGCRVHAVCGSLAHLQRAQHARWAHLCTRKRHNLVLRSCDVWSLAPVRMQCLCSTRRSLRG